MHAFMFFLLPVLVDVEFFAEEAVPVLLELSLRSLSDHFTFELNTVHLTLGHEIRHGWALATEQEVCWRHKSICFLTSPCRARHWIRDHLGCSIFSSVSLCIHDLVLARLLQCLNLFLPLVLLLLYLALRIELAHIHVLVRIVIRLAL